MGFACVAAGKVAALEHELRDHTVEFAALVAVALLAGAEGAEVLGGLGDDVVEELEVDAAGAGCHMPMSAAVHRSSIGHHQAIGEVCSVVAGDGLPFSVLSREVTLPLASHWASGPVQVQSLWQCISHCHRHRH